MKKLWILFLLLLGACSSQVENKPIALSFTQTGQTIVHLKPGPQPGPNLSGKSQVTLFADSGQVIFTSTIKLGNTYKLKFDGVKQPGQKYLFTSTTTGYVFDLGRGNNQYDSINSFDFGSTAVAAFNGDPNDWQLGRVIYKGTPATTVMWGMYVDTFHLKGRTVLYSGTYPGDTTYTNLNVGFTAKNGIIERDSSGSTLLVSGPSNYGFHFENWKISGVSNDKNDVGLLYVNGSGQVINFYRTSGYGYIERIIIAQLDGIPFNQKTEMRNCVDANTVLYGTVDVRIQTDQINSAGKYPIRGGDFYYVNNTSVNKTDRNNGYVTNAVVLGTMKDEKGKKFILHLDSCFAGNAHKSSSGSDNGSSLLKLNTGGVTPLIDSVNNMDLPPGKAIPAGLLDPYYFPVKGGILDLKKIGAQFKGTDTIVNPCPCIIHDTIYLK